MKKFSFRSHRFDRTSVAFIVLLIAGGSALLIGGNAGFLSPENTARFWPVTLVAVGLVNLLSWRDEERS